MLAEKYRYGCGSLRRFANTRNNCELQCEPRHSLKILLEVFQGRNDLLDRFCALGGVFSEEILLPAGPNLGLFPAGLLFRRYNDTNRILIDAVFDHRRIRKDGLDGLQGRAVFLLAAVSVSRLLLREAKRNGTHGIATIVGSGLFQKDCIVQFRLASFVRPQTVR